VVASKNDPKIEVLSEMNNMYRTLASLLLLVSVIAGYEWTARIWPFFSSIESYVAIVLLLALFLFSYRKQTQFINKRVEIKKAST
jgi:membrane protein YdbS with pleckstrin-like domain